MANGTPSVLRGPDLIAGNMEQIAIGNRLQVDVMQRDEGLIALRVGDFPLFQREVLVVESEFYFRRAAKRVRVFQGDERRMTIR